MNERITYLFERYFSKTATSEERLELADLINESQDHASLLQLIDRSWDKYDGNVANAISAENRNAILSRILKNENIGVSSEINPDQINLTYAASVHRVHFLKTAWFKYAAAILIIACTGAYLWTTSRKSTTEPTVTPANSIIADIAPARSKASLTLADGSIIDLESAANGHLATQQGSNIQKAGGQIIYDPLEQNVKSVTHNTMSTPRGGQYNLTLADGTRVWLNAASSITYPTYFTQKTRQVTITGEVFFEVRPYKDKPFIVRTNNESITVLGTSFNVHSYPDETSSKTTLIEGSIRINDKILKPGQAYINGQAINTDIQQDIAWKNGIFDFNNTDIKTAMRQFERWYDIDVVYEGELPAFDFQGKLPRSLTLHQVLKALNKVGLQSKLEGRKLIVSP